MTVSFSLPVIEASLGFIGACDRCQGTRQVYASGRHQARSLQLPLILSKQLVLLSNWIEEIVQVRLHISLHVSLYFRR